MRYIPLELQLGSDEWRELIETYRDLFYDRYGEDPSIGSKEIALLHLKANGRLTPDQNVERVLKAMFRLDNPELKRRKRKAKRALK